VAEERWFAAVLVLKSRVASELPHEPLGDIQYRILQAPDAESAYRRAIAIGRSEEQSYENADGREVSWSFLGLRDLRELPDGRPADGTEIYSQIARSNPNELVVPKEKLTVFWLEANQDRTVEDLLREDERVV
jgi:hypothetical protein